MKAQLALEHIGAFKYDRLRHIDKIISGLSPTLARDMGIGTFYIKPWIAEITGKSGRFGMERNFLRHNKGISKANNAFTRGVYLWFVLESGKYYEVLEMTSWRSKERYFCKVSGSGDVQRVEKDEVEEWLNGL